MAFKKAEAWVDEAQWYYAVHNGAIMVPRGGKGAIKNAGRSRPGRTCSFYQFWESQWTSMEAIN